MNITILSAMIRKNSKELRDKLEALGYKCGNRYDKDDITLNKKTCLYIYTTKLLTVYLCVNDNDLPQYVLDNLTNWGEDEEQFFT